MSGTFFRASKLVDRNNNTIAFAYIDADTDGQVDELSTITDPNGLVTSLAYPGTGGAGVSPARVCTITDPAGRVSTITRLDATTEQFNSLQLQSLCDSGQCTQGSPGLPLLAAEAVADYTDPRGNAWDHRLDWWGFGTVTQITDPLGLSAPAGHPLSYEWDVNGDGAFGDASGVQSTLSWTQLQGLGILDGPSSFAVRVRVNDGQGHDVSSEPTTLTVTNVPPAPDAGADQTVNEADLVTLTGSFSDPGTADKHTFNWHVVASNGQVIPDASEQNFQFVANDNGTYTVTFTVTDDDDSDSTVVFVIVQNTDPTAEFGNGGAVSEGTPGSMAFSNQFDRSPQDLAAGFQSTSTTMARSRSRPAANRPLSFPRAFWATVQEHTPCGRELRTRTAGTMTTRPRLLCRRVAANHPVGCRGARWPSEILAWQVPATYRLGFHRGDWRSKGTERTTASACRRDRQPTPTASPAAVPPRSTAGLARGTERGHRIGGDSHGCRQ